MPLLFPRYRHGDQLWKGGIWTAHKPAHWKPSGFQSGWVGHGNIWKIPLTFANLNYLCRYVSQTVRGNNTDFPQIFIKHPGNICDSVSKILYFHLDYNFMLFSYFKKVFCLSLRSSIFLAMPAKKKTKNKRGSPYLSSKWSHFSQLIKTCRDEEEHGGREVFL